MVGYLIGLGQHMEILIGILGLMITVLGGALGWFSKVVVSLTKTLAEVDKKLALLVQSDTTKEKRISDNEENIRDHEKRLSHLEGEHVAKWCKK